MHIQAYEFFSTSEQKNPNPTRSLPKILDILKAPIALL